MLDQITPVLLTLNEAPNISRTLSTLGWATQVVIVDSFSVDDTIKIIEGYPNVRVFQRRFDSHANQWNYSLTQTGLTTDWVLALDADYVLSPELLEEMRNLRPEKAVAGFSTAFQYCIYGKPLRGTVYPPKVTLFRRRHAFYEQDGHTQRVIVNGRISELRGLIRHDDRKPLSSWLAAQSRYMELEAVKLSGAAPDKLARVDRIRRKVVIAPFLMFFYCAFWQGNLLDGKAGLYYIFQRVLAEILLSLYLLQRRLSAK